MSISNKKPFFTKRRLIMWGLCAVIIILVIMIIGKRSSGSSEAEQVVVETGVPQVTVATVAELSSDQAPLYVTGSVESSRQATARAESQGQIVRLNYDLGDRVSRGATIASIENSRERAAVAQAQAALEQAQANIGQSSSINQTNLSNAELALDEAQNNARNTVVTTLSTADDAIRNKIDTIFSNAQTDNPKLVFQIPTSQQLQNQLEADRPKIQRLLEDWQSLSANPSMDSDGLVADLDTIETWLESLAAFIDDASAAANSLVASSQLTEVEIATWKGNTSAARSIITGAIQTVTGNKSALRGSETAVEIAQEQFDQSQSAGAGTTASATIAAAEAALRSAEISLNKTVIRAPLSGTITELNIEQGDFVSMFQEVVTVANNGTLEVIAYLTDRDARDLDVGTTVSIDGEAIAEIASIAPTVDAQTKKREITVALEDTSGIVNGQSVQLAIERGNGGLETPDELFVPLSALKVDVDGVVVLTVSPENTIRFMPVEIGPLAADKVLILSGIEAQDQIITDVRGLSEGETVEVIQ